MDYKEIKRRRLDKKMTQMEAAREIGVSLSGYRLWEAGVGKPTPENLVKLKRALNVTASE